MGARTKIDWCDASWNPVTGCLHDCQYCYAKRIAARFSTEQKYKRPYEPVLPVPTRRVRTKPEPYPYGFKPTFHRYRLDEPRHWKKPRSIFVCSMADLFGEWVPNEWIQEIFEACDKASQHRYMFLTKNPGRYAELRNLLPKHRRPPNVAEMWFGQSFTGAAHNYTPLLLPLWRNRFTSIEPLLRNLSRAEAIEIAATNEWVVVGAETGNRKEKVVPETVWLDNIATACAELGTPIFMKESLRELMGPDFRQEFPWEVSADDA